MNNFHYQEKLIAERNASIMGEKTYLTILRYYSDGEVQKFRESPYDQLQRSVYDTSSLQGRQGSRFFICLPVTKIVQLSK